VSFRAGFILDAKGLASVRRTSRHKACGKTMAVGVKDM
jgi:hypothetical protein